MSAAENDMLDALLARLAVLQRSASIDLTLMGDAPATAFAFERMDDARQSASRALLKSFEQLEDQIARIFRLLPKMFGADTSRWYGRDHADFMEKVGVLDEAAIWSDIVRLRNELVHDYPNDPAVRHARLARVVELLPTLSAVRDRLVLFVATEREKGLL